MTYLSLFSGAGGFEWFAKLMGWTCVGYVEKDEYCQKVIRARIRDGIFDWLTPEISERLMGWPDGATALEPLEMESFRLWLEKHGCN